MNVSRTATCYINGKSDSAPYLLADQLISLLCHSHSRNAAPVFLCIGTDLVTGDSLGPLVGTWLHCSSAFPYTVYGTLSQPVHAMNLKETMSKVSFSHPDSPVIAIDACLGTKKHLHYITIAPGALSPGAGVNKCLGTVGDISITGIINLSGEYAHMILQTTRPSAVMAMAECITKGILLACSGYSKQML